MHVAEVEQLPGFLRALEAVRRAGGVLLSDDAARALTLLALHSATPLIKAEVLADTADDLAEVAELLPAGDDTGLLLRLAGALDDASHQIRRSLNAI